MQTTQTWLTWTDATFAAAALAAARSTDEAGRFGSHKAYVSASWDAFRRAHGGETGLATFKGRVLACQRLGLLALARVDLVEYVDQAVLVRSEIRYGISEFHAIRV